VGENLNFFDRYFGPMILLSGIALQILGCIIIYKICDIEV
jgi:hypothetical protein